MDLQLPMKRSPSTYRRTRGPTILEHASGAQDSGSDLSHKIAAAHSNNDFMVRASIFWRLVQARQSAGILLKAWRRLQLRRVDASPFLNGVSSVVSEATGCGDVVGASNSC